MTVELASGQASSAFGLWLPRALCAQPGVTLEAFGPSLAQAHLELTLARARPFAARPAPWEAAGWERSFSTDRDEGGVRARASLRAVHSRDRGVWVAALVVACRPGRSALSLALTSPNDPRVRIERTFEVEVVPTLPRPQKVTMWFHGEDAWDSGVSWMRAALARAAREGTVCDGDTLCVRATARERDVERIARRTVRAPGRSRRQKTSRAASTIVGRARRGQYATLTIAIEHADLSPGRRGSLEQSQLESFAATAARRRDSLGDWAVCVEVIARGASPGD
jgi:hypothetical protein